MNPLKYLESRFVKSQLKINNKSSLTATDALAENQAIRAVMWIALKVCALFAILSIPVHYLCVVFHLIATPKDAVAQVLEAQANAKNQQESDKRLASEVAKGALSAVPNA